MRPVPRCTVPELPVTHVRRPGLEQRVEAGLAAGPVVVAARPGTGKTVLLASWARHRAAPTAWLVAEPEDGSTPRFWARALRALRAAWGTAAGSALDALPEPLADDPGFARLLVEACDEAPAPCTLVVDDLHVLAGTPAAESLAAAVRSRPGRLGLVLSGRGHAPLPLERLRLEGRLTELGSPELAFAREDAVRLLAAHDVHLAPGDVRTLLERTEGWAAALRLAAPALREPAAVAVTTGDLARRARGLAGYVEEEVLAPLGPATTAFLLSTCVAARVCPELADTLTGGQDGAEVLERLEQDDLLVRTDDARRTWYRSRPLVADVLRRRLRCLDPGRADLLHRRAAAWFAADGDTAGAAHHLRSAGDWDALARLTLRVAVPVRPGGVHPDLLEALDGLPADLVARSTQAAAAAAVAAWARGDVAGTVGHTRRSRELLGHRRPAGPDPGPVEVVLSTLGTLDALVASAEGDVERQVRAARDAAEQASRVVHGPVALHALRAVDAAVEGYGLLWAGHLGRAGRTFTAALAGLQAPGGTDGPAWAGPATTPWPALALQLHAGRAVAAAARGRLADARRDLDQVSTLVERDGWTRLPVAAPAYLAEAVVRLHEADAQGCGTALQRGRACLDQQVDPSVVDALGLVEARLLLDRGDPEAARDRLAAGRRRRDDRSASPLLGAWRKVLAAEVALRTGEAGRALVALGAEDAGSPCPSARDARTLALASALLRTGGTREALRVLGPLLREGSAGPATAVEAWLLAACAHDRLREDAGAQAALARSLAAAADQGLVRPYAVVDPCRTVRLLRTWVRTTDEHRLLVQRLTGLLGGTTHEEGARAEVVPLTSREQSVLLLLPTMMSNSEIADELSVSVNTVKVHLKSSYRKLGVSNRRQAVARARDLGLARSYPVPGSAQPSGRGGAADQPSRRIAVPT